MGNCCPGSSSGSRRGSGGSGSSSDSSHYSAHRYHDRYDEGGHTRVSRRAAQELLLNSPAPTVRAGRFGRRPHAHLDLENDYAAERIELSPIPGAPRIRTAGGSRSPPRLWGYAGNPDFDYATQNSRGRPSRNQRGEASGPEPGPIRIVADRDRNIVGVSYHPDGDEEGFRRATYHPRRSRHH